MYISNWILRDILAFKWFLENARDNISASECKMQHATNSKPPGKLLFFVNETQMLPRVHKHIKLIFHRVNYQVALETTSTMLTNNTLLLGCVLHYLQVLPKFYV